MANPPELMKQWSAWTSTSVGASGRRGGGSVGKVAEPGVRDGREARTHV
jgi:hypothetical protein